MVDRPDVGATGRGDAPGPPAPAPLVALGWDERVEQLWSEVAEPGWVPGRVVRTSRRFTYVGTADGLVQAAAVLGLEPAPVAGDWVALVTGELEGSEQVVAVLPRWSQLSRRDPSGESGEQILAADVDHVLIVLGLDRPVKPGRVERSLVLAWESGAAPAIVLTKADAADDAAAVADQVRAVAGEVDVHVLSSATGDGTEVLRRYLDGHRTVVLLGESGAGKSTLVNHLAGEEVQRTADVRAGDAKGRHTTVTRDLIVLPPGGVVIDTPGLRSLGLLDADEGLAATFADIEELAASCRFRDCRHDAEPGCAVQAAATDGVLDPDRVGRYLAMQRELEEGAARQDEAARRRRGRGGAKGTRQVERQRAADEH